MRQRGVSRGLALTGLPILVLLAIAAWLVTGRIAASSATTAPAGTIGAARDDGGLRLALMLPAGPYFRDELLPVTLTLTNDSTQPALYAGTLPHGLCGLNALDAILAHRGYPDPTPVSISFAPSCPRPRPVTTALKPGASLRTQLLLGLPIAGRLTVIGRASFPMTTSVTTGILPNSGSLARLRHLFPTLFRSIHTPFMGGWPDVSIDVTPRVPANKVLRLARQGHAVYLQGYAHIAQPVAQQLSAVVEGQGMGMMGMPIWTPLSAGALSDPTGGGSEKWEVLVGAPGYAIAHAVYCFNPRPNAVFGGTPGSSHYSVAGCTEIVRG